MAKNDRLDNLAREAAARLPRDTWIVTRTPLADTYPCQCHVRPAHAIGWKTWSCSPAFCPCAGRDPEGMPADCCSWRVGPEQHVMAKAAWDLTKREREELLG